jgi:antitoxin component YwqK of YwqJK toxin-antitoxin module
MKKLITVLFFFFALSGFGQEKTYAEGEIYFYDDLAYKESDGHLFTGTIPVHKKNGRLISEETYTKGFLTKEVRYFNKSGTPKIYSETYFYEAEFKRQKVVYYYPNGSLYRINYFDLNEEKTLMEDYDDTNKLIYSCEYKNGRKHGKEFCITKKCANMTDYYVDGKKVK